MILFQNSKMTKSILSIALFFIIAKVTAQIPLLYSNPNAGKVIYLDFDGQVVTGTSWNSGNTVNAAASTLTSSPSGITTIWKRMSEDYYPFDVNITTDSNAFNSAPANLR